MKNLLLLSIILLVSGCSTVRIIQTDHVPEFSLSNYKTFDFYLLRTDIPAEPDFTKRIGWMKDEIRKQFEARGIVQSKDNPDLLVNIGIIMEERIQTRETDFATDAPKYMSSRNYYWESEMVEVGRYHHGTVSVDLVEPEKTALVWFGLAESIAVKKDDSAKKNIAIGVEKLFSEMNSD